MNTKALREKRAEAANKATALLTRAESENRNLTAEERQQFDAIHAECEAFKQDIDRAERQAALDAELASTRGAPRETATPSVPGEVTEEVRTKALRTWLLHESPIGGSTEGREAAQRCNVDLNVRRLELRFATKAPRNQAEARALTTTTLASGGAIVEPAGFLRSIESALLAFSSMREVASVIRTDKGETLQLPTCKDTNNKGEILAESGDVNSADPTFALVSFGAHLYSSKMVQLPITLLQDTSFPLEPFLGDKLGERIARIQQDHFTTGTGASQPQGIVTAATLGKTAAGAAAITYAELLALKHSVDPAYRANAKFMAQDATILALKQMVDSTGRPLWAPGIAVGSSDLIDGTPFIVNQSMTAIATGVKSVLFGDFSKYLIRDVTGFSLVRLNERYAEKGMVAFLLFARSDAGLVDAGANPIKYLVQA